MLFYPAVLACFYIFFQVIGTHLSIWLGYERLGRDGIEEQIEKSFYFSLVENVVFALLTSFILARFLVDEVVGRVAMAWKSWGQWILVVDLVYHFAAALLLLSVCLPHYRAVFNESIRAGQSVAVLAATLFMLYSSYQLSIANWERAPPFPDGLPLRDFVLAIMVLSPLFVLCLGRKGR